MGYHIDGEPYVGGASIVARPHPAALRVMVPADAPWTSWDGQVDAGGA
jgi:hypothetical protein